MPKTPPNHGKDWTSAQEARLCREAAQNTPTRILGLHLGRTPGAVQQHASEMGLSLKPTNQSPYGTQKKR